MDYNKLTKYVFSGGLTALFSDNTSEDLYDYIKIMRFECNFEEYRMPILFIKFEMRPDIIIKIQNDNSVIFNLFINDVPEDAVTTNIYDVFIKNIRFKPVRMDKTPINYTDKVDKSETTNYQYEMFEIILVPEICLKENKFIVSGILSNVTMTDVIVYLLDKLDVKSIIMPPDNDKKYDQIILIPGNIFMNLEYLESVYGIYNCGSKCFFSYDKLLIYSREGSLKNGNISVNIRFPSKDNNSTSFDMGIYTEGNNKIMNIIRDNIKLSNYEESFKEIYGNNQYYYSRDVYGVNDRIRKRDLIEDNNQTFNKTKVYFNKYNNEQKENEFNYYTSDHTIIELFFDNINLTIEDCMKIFTLKFDNEFYKRYNGNYHVLHMGYHYVKKNSILDMKGIILLKKI